MAPRRRLRAGCADACRARRRMGAVQSRSQRRHRGVGDGGRDHRHRGEPLPRGRHRRHRQRRGHLHVLRHPAVRSLHDREAARCRDRRVPRHRGASDRRGGAPHGSSAPERGVGQPPARQGARRGFAGRTRGGARGAHRRGGKGAGRHRRSEDMRVQRGATARRTPGREQERLARHARRRRDDGGRAACMGARRGRRLLRLAVADGPDAHPGAAAGGDHPCRPGGGGPRRAGTASTTSAAIT